MGVWETGLPFLLPKIKAFCQHSLCSLDPSDARPTSFAPSLLTA